jgi:aminodeoxyfutalosine synthase
MTRFNLMDPSLEPIAEKVLAGERLTKRRRHRAVRQPRPCRHRADGRLRAPPINGDRVYFMVNRHINPTNICRNRCKFCAFARSEGEEGAYEMTLDARWLRPQQRGPPTAPTRYIS